MYAYGGAGPVHATALARELGIRRVVVPLSDLAAGWSAFGVASSEAVVVEEVAKALTYPFDPEEMNAEWAALEEKVGAAMASQGIGVDTLAWERLADIRYSQQINQVAVVAPQGDYTAAVAQALVDSFEQEYERLFGADSGYAAAGFALTAMRVRARASVSDFRIARHDSTNGAGGRALTPKGKREVIFYERSLVPEPTPTYDGAAFARGMHVNGPGIVEFQDTTLVLRHGDHAIVDAFGSVIVDVG
jgi:N-methylhydantoinase A